MKAVFEVEFDPDFMADRIYAPEVDFKEHLIKSKKTFWWPDDD